MSITTSKMAAVRGASTPSTLAGSVLSAFSAMLKENTTATKTVGDLGRTMAVESFSTADADLLRTSTQSLMSDLERNLNTMNVGASSFTTASKIAAREAFALASNVKAVVSQTVNYESTEPGFVGVQGVSDILPERTYAREAYDERDNANVLANTVTYNLLAGRQAPAAELFYPTVVVPHDQMGVAVTIRLHQVMKDKKRSLQGRVTDFERVNLINAMIDDTILRNDGTLAVPVLRTAGAGKNDDLFMAGAVGQVVNFEGVNITTAPLAFNKKIDLLAISQTDELVASGLMDITDSLDSDILLESVILKVGAQRVVISTKDLVGANFIYVGQGNYREQKLHLRTKSLFITKDSVTYEGTALDPAGALATVASGVHSVRLEGVFTGEVNINEGQIELDKPSAPVVGAVVDVATKTVVTATTGATLATALGAAEFVGWNVQARRANTNKRERGDLIDTQYFKQIWAVPVRSPVSALRPANAPAGQDADDLEKLASTSFARTTGGAYRHLEETIAQLRFISNQNLEKRVVPEALGPGRHLINSLLLEEDLDFAVALQSLQSKDLPDNISSLVVNHVRDLFYRLYRDTKMQAVVESGAAGTTEQPTAIVMCDPLVARYLMVSGDVRTLGPDFKMKVETTPNKRLENKIVVAFGYPDKVSANEVNAMHFGAHLWSTELALVLPVSRNGQVSKELTVSPRFRHICNMPALGVLHVKNLHIAVKERVPVDFNQI